MLSVQLHNLSFRAFHGLYHEESIVGNEFIIDLIVQYTPHKTTHISLDETINYVSLFHLVKTRMEKPSPLLEEIAFDITKEIFTQFKLAENISISIKKQNPPIKDFEGSISISLETNRKDFIKNN